SNQPPAGARQYLLLAKLLSMPRLHVLPPLLPHLPSFVDRGHTSRVRLPTPGSFSRRSYTRHSTPLWKFQPFWPASLRRRLSALPSSRRRIAPVAYTSAAHRC